MTRYLEHPGHGSAVAIMSNLNPCPSCGCKEVFTVCDTVGQCFYVECSNCHAKGEPADYTKHGDAADVAHASWNDVERDK